jgi:IS1 family transposase
MNFGRSSKKNKHCEDPEQEGVGDFWIYTAIKSDSGLLIVHCGGKRSNVTCARFLDGLFDRIRLPGPTSKIIVSTDGNPQYIDTLANLYCEPCIDYGQVIKRKENNRLVEIIRAKIMGNPAICSISTSIVEGYNNKIRQRISRFARRTASFSKSVFSCINALNMFQFMNNFIDLKKNRMTPAMIEKISDHAWTWGEFLSQHI